MTDQDRAPESGQAGSLAPLPYMPPQLPDLSSLRFLGGEDLSEHFRRLEEITRRREAEESAPSALTLPDFVALSVEDSLDLGEDGADLLEDARANIARGEYTLALEQLAQFLEISPGHHEARYLQAYCHYQLDGSGLMTALGILRPMRDEPVQDPAVRAGVKELRTKLRRVLTPKEIKAFLGKSRRDPQAAADRLQRFIELAPEEPEPPYLLAVTQALNGEFESALRTAQAGIKQADGDNRELRALADVLTTVVIRPLARRAVRELFDGAYRRARNELAKLDPEWRETELLRDLDAFLADLCQRRHSPAKPLPAPQGSADRVDRLYALITDEHGPKAVELLNARDFAGAERVVAKMLHIVPAFPPVNYLYAICLCIQGREPERAIAAAEIAARDPSLLDTKLLLRTAREMPEILAIKAAYDEHNAAVKSASRKRAPSQQELNALRRTMERLRDRMPELQSVATTRQGTKRVRDLAKAVEQQLAEIDMAMGNMAVNDLVLRFNRWAEEAATARTSRVRPRSILDQDFYRESIHFHNTTELTEIAREARRLHHTTTDPRARQLLQQLLDTIDRIVP